MKRFLPLILLALSMPLHGEAVKKKTSSGSGSSTTSSRKATSSADSSPSSSTKSKSSSTSASSGSNTKGAGSDSASSASKAKSQDTGTDKAETRGTGSPKKSSPETSSSASKSGSESDASEKGRDSDKIKEGPSTDGPPVAAVSSIEEQDIQGFEHYAPQIQELIRKCLGLTKQNLTYTFGSADPKNGGMDCSGTIYFVLHDFGFKGVPRQSNEMADWVEDKTLLYRVHGADSLSHGEFTSLQPGNLLFWSGTYDAGPRKTPVTHVMLYLGKLKSNGKHIVFGASDGRAYQGKRRSGVSVFDFSLPKSTSTAKFYGYGMIPGVNKIEQQPQPKPEIIASNVNVKPAGPATQKVLADAKEAADPGPIPDALEKPATVAKTTAAAKTGEKAKPSTTPLKPVTVAEVQPRTPTPSSETKPEPTKETPVAKSPRSDVASSSSATAKKLAPVTVAEAKAPTTPADDSDQEEIRPAIRVDQQPEVASAAAPKATDTSTKADASAGKSSTESRSGSSTAQSKSKTSSGSSTAATKKKTGSGSGSATKSRTVTKRRAAPPPTAMDKARRATGDFFENVRRSLPGG